MGKVHLDWRLEAGVAGPANFILLLLVLLSFPLVLRGTGALAITVIDPFSSQHTPALLRFCFVLAAFLWICFAIALGGIRIRGKVSFHDLIGIRWSRLHALMLDIGIAVLVLLVMVKIGNLSNKLLGPFQRDTAAFRSMVAQNSTQALAFLTLALTAGFVEELSFEATFSGSVRPYAEIRCWPPRFSSCFSHRDISTRVGYGWYRFC